MLRGYFNPMYLYSKCDGCQREVGVVCADCNGYVCRDCHNPPKMKTIWQIIKGMFCG